MSSPQLQEVVVVWKSTFLSEFSLEGCPFQQWWDCRSCTYLLTELLGAGKITLGLPVPTVYCRWHLNFTSLLFCSWKADAIHCFCFDLNQSFGLNRSSHLISMEDQVSFEGLIISAENEPGAGYSEDIPLGILFVRQQQAGWWLVGSLQKDKHSCPECSSSTFQILGQAFLRLFLRWC